MHTLPVHTPGHQFSLFERFREPGTISSTCAAGVDLAYFQVFQELWLVKKFSKKTWWYLLLKLDVSLLTTFAPKPCSTLPCFTTVDVKVEEVAVGSYLDFDATFERLQGHVLFERGAHLKLHHHFIYCDVLACLAHFSKLLEEVAN